MKKIAEGYEPFLKGRQLYKEEGGISSDIYEVLVRKDSSDRGSELVSNPNYVGKRLKLPTELENFQEVRRHVEEDLDVLREHLSRFMPKLHLSYVATAPSEDIAQAREGEIPESKIQGVEAYMYVEKVTPHEHYTREDYYKFFKELNDFLCRCAEMFMATLDKNNHLGVVPDLTGKNLIYGTLPNGTEAHLYLIDYYQITHEHADYFADKMENLIHNYVTYNKDYFKETIQWIKKLRNHF